jgi:carbamoyltransferase
LKILGVNMSHDGSVCVLEDGAVIFYQEEERLTHEKHTTGFINSFAKAMRLHDPEHIVFVGAFPYELNPRELLSNLLLSMGKTKHFSNNKKYQAYWLRDHHLAHATVAYNNSGFEDAGVLVIDGAGQAFVDDNYLYRESETIYSADTKDIHTLHKNLITQHSSWDYGELAIELSTMPYFSKCSVRLPRNHPYTIYPSNLSLGKMFSAMGIKIFNSYHNAGKVMGLSAYGKNNDSHPRAFVDGKANLDILESDLSDEDLAYRVQHDSLPVSIDLIRKAIEMSGSKNICLSGGYFLNCVNNYKYLKEFPEINFYVEPNSSDSGTAIGAAQWLYKKLTNKNAQPINLMYLGSHANYSLSDHTASVDATPEDIAELLAERNIVAIYQGQAESGPRALGNRSILYDPRDTKGRDVVNAIKKREFFRPFAGSVLEEFASEWFDMQTLKASSEMMYAVESLPNKRDLVPALQHNDGTSRIQTVSEDQNAHYYNLIKAFSNITGVPMLLNTSFNLAGDTLVDNIDDAIHTCRESGIKYLYCPELSKLILV